MSEHFRMYDPEACGSDGYPKEWHWHVKHAVRELAGHRCERCKHPYIVGANGRGEWSDCDTRCSHDGPYRYQNREGEWRDGDLLTPNALHLHALNRTPVQAKWRILTVHHLDGNKWNCQWWNLAALCQRCHLQIQGKVRMEQTYPFEHSEWFKPHAAGYYAFAYRGQELTREETLEQLDDLLALERVA